MHYKGGTKKVEIEGKEYIFHFGMNAQDLYTLNVNEKAGTITILKTMFWAALMARQEENGLSNSFTLKDLGDLSDKMTAEVFNELKEEALTCLGFMNDLTIEMIPRMMRKD